MAGVKERTKGADVAPLLKCLYCSPCLRCVIMDAYDDANELNVLCPLNVLGLFFYSLFCGVVEGFEELYTVASQASDSKHFLTCGPLK